MCSSGRRAFSVETTGDREEVIVYLNLAERRGVFALVGGVSRPRWLHCNPVCFLAFLSDDSFHLCMCNANSVGRTQVSYLCKWTYDSLVGNAYRNAELEARGGNTVWHSN